MHHEPAQLPLWRQQETLQTTTALPIDHHFDEAFANQIAQLESYNKHHYRPNTYLHKWWARRCGSTFRLILKHLVTDPAQQNYYTPGGLAGKIILDPMMGGGTTLHEAIRLGANVIGVDIDPIPVLQARATLSQLPLPELETTFDTFYQTLHTHLAPYFKTTCPHCTEPVPLQFTLYGLRRTCACGPALIIDSTILRQESNGHCIHLCPRCYAVTTEPHHQCHHQQPIPLIERRHKTCATCHQPYREMINTPYYQRYRPLVIVGHCSTHRLFFKAVDTADLTLWQQANAQRPHLPFTRQDFKIEAGRKSIQLIQNGITNYLDLFSSRQLHYLHHTIQQLPKFAPLLTLNLALLVSTSLEFNAMLCGYKGKNKRRAGAVRHTFSHHAYAFPYTALENNPIYPRMKSGTLKKLFHARIRRGRQWAQHPRERLITTSKAQFIEVAEKDSGTEATTLAELATDQQRFWLQQGSATQLQLADNSVDFIVTDPPYYDSVQYSDLATFFRVWLRHFLPDNANWAYNTADSAVDPHHNDKESRYIELLSGIFRECQRVLRPKNGRFIFTFHHWNPKAWAALTIALKHANFTLINRYIVHSENPISVHITNMKALTHDAILLFARQTDVNNASWHPPSHINQNDSYQFCHDCATYLGWILTQPFTDTTIKQKWQTALK